MNNNPMEKMSAQQPPRVEIHAQDEKNSQAIMEKIRTEKITDEAIIRSIVDSYEFSSPKTKQHISDGLVGLLKIGALNDVPPKTITLDAVDTDVHTKF